MGKLIVSIRDYDGEASTVTFPTTDMTAGNFAAQAALITTLAAALEDIQLGNTQRYTRVVSVSPQGVGPSADVDAQRERKWLVKYHDGTTFEKAKLEIPCADSQFLDPANRRIAEILFPGDMRDFRLAFEAVVVGPGGNLAVVDEISLVGRPL